MNETPFKSATQEEIMMRRLTYVLEIVEIIDKKISEINKKIDVIIKRKQISSGELQRK